MFIWCILRKPRARPRILQKLRATPLKCCSEIRYGKRREIVSREIVFQFHNFWFCFYIWPDFWHECNLPLGPLKKNLIKDNWLLSLINWLASKNLGANWKFKSSFGSWYFWLKFCIEIVHHICDKYIIIYKLV